MLTQRTLWTRILRAACGRQGLGHIFDQLDCAFEIFFVRSHRDHDHGVENVVRHSTATTRELVEQFVK
ncbi:hypothetical protein ACN93_19000 [Gordonia paraffinivorans]|nr:hypothetical protein ACN93_19000 [Gordonia paraffinivorans]